FVNGQWIDKTEIPGDRARWGRFDDLRQNTDRDGLGILDATRRDKKYRGDSDQGEPINLYRTIVDTVARTKNGIKRLKPYPDKIDKVKTVGDLQALMTEMEPLGGIGFIGINVGPDAKDSNRNVIYVGPGPVGLPDRDYYVSDDADSKEKREKYVEHVARMLTYLGEKPAQAKANASKILALETAMSEPRLNRVERRDRRKTYNPMTEQVIQKLITTISRN